MIRAVVFDMDGVMISSEEIWDEVREELVRERGGAWRHEAHATMMGMSTPEWTGYMHGELGLPMDPDEIAAEVTRRLAARYRERLPLLAGVPEAVRALAARWPLGVASSSPQELIELVLDLAGLRRLFAVVVSSERVARGKPAPDVYLAALDRLGVPPAEAAAVEDSSGGLRAARAAGMRVVAIPNPIYPPSPEALGVADVVLPDARALTPEAIEPA
ncbi:MAG: HAD family hydrolase [Thermoleophilia bacterium]